MSTATSSLAARFGGMQEARVAIEALEHHGIDGSDIALAGRVAHKAAEPGDELRSELRAARYLGRCLAKGLVIGIIAGGVAGILLGLLLTSGSAAALLAFLLCGVLLGAVVGIFVSYERGVGISEAFELTFHEPTSGPVWVAIRSTDPDTLGRASKVLSDLSPLEIRHR